MSSKANWRALEVGSIDILQVILPLECLNTLHLNAFERSLKPHSLGGELRLLWRHKGGETHLSDDAAFAKAWQRSACDRGGRLELQVCRNVQQMSSACLAQRTCGTCGLAFGSRNLLMRHIRSLNHYVGEAKGYSPKQLEVAEPLRLKAWEAYYEQMPWADFRKVSELMRSPVAYAFRLVASSPLQQVVLKALQQMASPQKHHFDLTFTLNEPTPDAWDFLQVAQDVGALQRQEAASMLPVMLLEVGLKLQVQKTEIT